MKRQLTSENIDIVSMEVGEYLIKNKVDKKDILRIKLGIEECLMGFQKYFGQSKEFECKFGNFFSKTKIIILVEGEQYNPFANLITDENTAFIRSALNTLGNLPSWTYTGKLNQISFNIDRKQLPSWVGLALSIFFAVVLGFLARSLSSDVSSFIQNDLFSPILNTFIGFLNAIAGPMIFFSVVWGIYSMGDATTFSSIGKKLTVRFLIYIFVISIVTGTLSTFLFNLNYGVSSGSGNFSPIYQMVLDIIPNNLFTPFTYGNTLQILFVAIVIGIAMIIMGEKSKNVAAISEQLNLIVQSIMKVISKLVPFYIFCSLFCIILSSDLSSLSFAGKFFFVTIAACVFMMVVQTVFTSINLKTSPFSLMKKSGNTFLIALTTASSSACFSSNINTCMSKYNIDKKLTNFGVPFVQILYKPGVSMVYFVAVLSMAEYNCMTISITWIITALVMSIILSAATPTIPGGSLASFSVLFLQLGIPTECLAVVLGLNVILDFLHTAANVYCGQLLLADESKAFNKRDGSIKQG